ncbi:hypothetical protein RRG08_064298 [Elysia crispata]|uniref:Uncharacterized protein n=1 Tax=Elysia crispata TaxID=231223 RepID=A0AAE0YTY8_9GAST|nr:hypothetical protein RRG08_064298 [Elysia crispata]
MPMLGGLLLLSRQLTMQHEFGIADDLVSVSLLSSEQDGRLSTLQHWYSSTHTHTILVPRKAKDVCLELVRVPVSSLLIQWQ